MEFKKYAINTPKISFVQEKKAISLRIQIFADRYDVYKNRYHFKHVSKPCFNLAYPKNIFTNR